MTTVWPWAGWYAASMTMSEGVIVSAPARVECRSSQRLAPIVLVVPDPLRHLELPQRCVKTRVSQVKVQCDPPRNFLCPAMDSPRGPSGRACGKREPPRRRRGARGAHHGRGRRHPRATGRRARRPACSGRDAARRGLRPRPPAPGLGRLRRVLGQDGAPGRWLGRESLVRRRRLGHGLRGQVHIL